MLPEVSSVLLHGYFLHFTTCAPELTGEVQTGGCAGGYRRQGRFQDLGRQRSAGMMSFPQPPPGGEPVHAQRPQFSRQ